MSDIKIIHNQFIGIYENIISKEDCNLIINDIENQLNKNVHEEGSTQFSNQELARLSYSTFASENQLSNVFEKINQSLNVCMSFYAKEYFTLKQLRASSVDVKLQKIPPRGGFHLWHCEQDNKNVSRVLVWMVYLNDIPEGEGETEFIFQALRIKPQAGTFVFFPASFTHTHRGNAVYSCNKYIATGWYNLN